MDEHRYEVVIGVDTRVDRHAAAIVIVLAKAEIDTPERNLSKVALFEQAVSDHLTRVLGWFAGPLVVALALLFLSPGPFIRDQRCRQAYAFYSSSQSRRWIEEWSR